jgi:hypothetical protein
VIFVGFSEMLGELAQMAPEPFCRRRGPVKVDVNPRKPNMIAMVKQARTQLATLERPDELVVRHDLRHLFMISHAGIF